MHESRAKAGMLLLSGNEEMKQILVVGGFKKTTELLTISCINIKDRGHRNISCFLQWAHISNWYVSHVPYAVTYRLDGYGDVDELNKNPTNDYEVEKCSVIQVRIYHLPG